jgi:glucosamine-6-phosphate deaminase
MIVHVYESNDSMGAAAADDLAEILKQAIAEHGKAAAILATGNSQLSFMKAMRRKTGIAWDRITLFHMDEYLGMPESHPASFRRYIRENLADHVHPRMFYGVQADAPDIDAEMARYAALLAEHQPVACVLGVGENGHLAFNDPPADFANPEAIHVVTLAHTARMQQVGEGHFATVDDVPQQAISLTIPTLMRPAHVLAVVPEARKAQAIKDALEGPVSPDCPASFLRTLPHVKLYLDPESASLLRPGALESAMLGAPVAQQRAGAAIAR